MVCDMQNGGQNKSYIWESSIPHQDAIGTKQYIIKTRILVIIEFDYEVSCTRCIHVYASYYILH